jgi:hypothetical protein
MNIFEDIEASVVEAANANDDPRSEGYGRVLELTENSTGRVLATVCILSGNHHDILCEFIEQHLDAQKIKPS